MANPKHQLHPGLASGDENELLVSRSPLWQSMNHSCELSFQPRHGNTLHKLALSHQKDD